MERIERRLPVRVSLVVMITAVAVANGILGHFGLGMTDDTLGSLVLLVGAAVAGDTYRPSGRVKSTEQ